MSSQTQGARGRFSLLGLLGQESLYLLLTASLFLNVVLTILLDSRSGPPPIINLDESQGYAFPSGEATLSQYTFGYSTNPPLAVPKWCVSIFVPFGMLSSSIYFLRQIVSGAPATDGSGEQL